MILRTFSEFSDYVKSCRTSLVAIDIRGTLLKAPRGGHLSRALQNKGIPPDVMAHLDSVVPALVLERYKEATSVVDWTMMTLLEAANLASTLEYPIGPLDIESAFQALNSEYRTKSVALVDDNELRETIVSMRRLGVDVIFAADGPSQRERDVLRSCLPNTAALNLDVFSSELAGINKLSDTYFVRLVELYDRRPSDVLIVGDRIDKDVMPALRAGCHAIHIGSTVDTNFPTAESMGAILASKPERMPHAVVLGRFQPFHSEHARYVLAALEAADHVTVGITHPYAAIEEIGDTRNSDGANPLPLWLRREIISGWARNERIDTRTTVIPIPLSSDGLKSTIRNDTVVLVTDVEPWSRKKISLIESAGFTVNILDVGEKTISGSQIRTMIRNQDHRWREMVPMTVDNDTLKVAYDLIKS
ncbi:HAD hydrolase-like protein [Nocardia arizonensis]|uniref:HAD hydrolase-like protein n=1 Tax=Nocardia arizonensis TaxID=1141647 RepID=UPI000A9E8726|nr:HAD hydrolase-like protein [Nocardia arizonensis]